MNCNVNKHNISWKPRVYIVSPVLEVQSTTENVPNTQLVLKKRGGGHKSALHQQIVKQVYESLNATTASSNEQNVLEMVMQLLAVFIRKHVHFLLFFPLPLITYLAVPLHYNDDRMVMVIRTIRLTLLTQGQVSLPISCAKVPNHLPKIGFFSCCYNCLEFPLMYHVVIMLLMVSINTNKSTLHVHVLFD